MPVEMAALGTGTSRCHSKDMFTHCRWASKWSSYIRKAVTFREVKLGLGVTCSPPGW